MQHDTTIYNMIQQHTTRWSNGANFFFTTNVVRCCMKSWDRLTGALLSKEQTSYVEKQFCEFVQDSTSEELLLAKALFLEMSKLSMSPKWITVWGTFL